MASPKRTKIDSDEIDPEIYNDSSSSLFAKQGFMFNTECDFETDAEFAESPRHAILFEPPRSNGQEQSEKGASGAKGNAKTIETPITREDWDENNYVKLPFYEYNLEPETNKSLWNVIKRSLNELSQTLDNDFDYIHVEYAILKYNRKYKTMWNFSVLHQLFDQIEEEQQDHMKKLLQKMIKLALDAPNLLRKPIPILKAGQTFSVSLTQEQCACILANAFFCTFPDRWGAESPSEMPYINFNGILNDSGSRRSRVKMEKLVCLFHYFNRVCTKMPEGVVTFSRLTLDADDTPSFESSTSTFNKVLLLKDGTIEDCTGALQLDFANKYLGGGVLNTGCVQEEIRFLICPELMVSMLFTERLEDNESVVIKGCERFSSYKGYSSSFKWDGDYVDTTKRDKWNRLHTHVLAIDALPFSRSLTQFEQSNVNRELVKCYSGLKKTLENMKSPGNTHPAVATGNWGCGAFNGDKQLKFIIQLMAAAAANRDLIYYTFNNAETYDDLVDILGMIRAKNLTVGQMYRLLMDYTVYVESMRARKSSSSKSSSSSSESFTTSPQDKASKVIRPIRDFLKAKLQPSEASAAT